MATKKPVPQKEASKDTSDVITVPIPTISSLGQHATPILIILLIIAAFLLGMLTTKVQYLEGQKSSSNVLGTQPPTGTNPIQPTAIPQRVNVALGHLPVLGNENAKVEVVEFADLQCLFCRKLWKETLPQIKKDYVDTGKIKFSFRHYPLSEIHPAAQASAEAAECANEQNKFWEYHDKVYEEQAKKGDGTISYTTDDLKTWAQDIGLDTVQFNNCLDSGKYAAKVQEDLDAGLKAGVNGTPATFVNGVLVTGASPYSVFKSLIDKELAK